MQDECARDVEILARAASNNKRLKKLTSYLKKIIHTIPEAFPEDAPARWTRK